MVRAGCLLAMLAGCGAEDEVVDTGRPGQCGEVTAHNVELVVTVVGADAVPVVGATVELAEQAWQPGTLGTAVTDGSGVAILADLEITSVEDCWGTALDYVLSAELDGRTASESINPTLFNAINGGGGEAVRSITLPD